MVYIDDQDHGDDSLHEERTSNTAEDVSDGNESSSVTSQTCSQLFVEVRGHGHVHPVRIDLHSISSLTREVDCAHRNSSSATIPSRSVSSLRSRFDMAGPSSAYSHSRELGGRSSVLALQVPASSLPPPLTASVIVDSFQINASNAFFSPLPSGDGGSPSTRESLPCMPCQAPQDDSRSASAFSPPRNSCHANSGVQTRHLCVVGQGEVVRRLTEVLQGRGDDALVLQSTNRDNMMSQWLQALDVHVVGACRADERLQPILRWNTPCSGADGHLLAHLSQHFKLKELGMLARCLCAPLVSVRVGKVRQEGRFLCPTALRGYLSLTMLPCSEIRLSFIGDNGDIERIAAVSFAATDTHVFLEMLDADPSGRSFVLKLPGGKHYFWQSEKAMTAGDELVSEMRGFLLRRPTLSQLTGVHEHRLNSFVSQLQSNLAAASSSAGFQRSCTASPLSSTSSTLPKSSPVMSPNPTSSCGLRQSPRLSPRSSGFKEGTSRGSINIRSVIFSRDKHRRRLDKSNPASSSSLANNQSSSSGLDVHSDLKCTSKPFRSNACLSQEESIGPLAGLVTSSSYVSGLCGHSPNNDTRAMSAPLVSASLSSSPSLISSTIGGSSFTSNGLHLPLPSHLSIPSSTLLAPYYCPCPMRSSALQYTFTPPFLPPVGDMNNGPASSTSFSVKPSSAILSQTTISLDRVSISPIPLPVSSLVNVPTPLQTSYLSSFFSDPIVHIPVVDFQSANKGFLVNGAPPVSSSGFPGVLPSFLSNILSGGERSVDGQETPGLSILQGLGIHRRTEGEDGQDSEEYPFLINGRFVARCPDNSSAKDGAEQVSDTRWSASSSTELNRFPEFSGPLLGMVPAVLTSGSLSCVLNFHQERSTAASAWVSGSRALYGGSCVPGPAPSITTCSTSLGIRIRGAEVQTSADKVDSFRHGNSQDLPSEDEASQTD